MDARELASRATFEALSALPDTDPLRQPLRRWVFRLMEQRIDRGVLCAIASERSVERHVIETPVRDRLTLSELVQRALADRARRAAWLASAIGCSERHSAAVALAWERRQEIARRLGLDHFDALEPHAAAIVAAAERLLAKTDEVAAEWRTQSLAELVENALATDALRGWPARLSLRTLADFFSETRLLDGLDLDPGSLPQAIAPASFLRGSRRLGAAFSEAAAGHDRPFSVAYDPRGLRRRMLGNAFASVPLGPTFMRRALGLGSEAARQQARALWRAILLETRAQALRVLLRERALASRAALEEAFEERVERVFGVSLPRSAAGSLWRLHVDDPERFAAQLLAALRVQRLVELHDEDWYRNPRACDELRAEAALPPQITLGADEIDRGLDLLSRRLADELA